MKKPTLMIQGCTSDAGKSTLVTGLCRLFYRRGIRVAPFKPQNMALNSAVTIDGGEIGRAQALQAQASGLQPHSDMNPVLLKPNSDTGAQVIIHGHALHDMQAKEYHNYKTVAMKAVLESYNRLQQQYDLILVEGAGSPAEINLRDRDIANMGFAEAVDCPVILVADIDRGGVFAHLHGTLALLSTSEQERIKGFVINRFRGDIKLLQSGLDWLEESTRKPVLGVLPYLHGLHLDAEDAIQSQQIIREGKPLKIVVPVIPRISNHTDFDPLRCHPQIDIQFIGPHQTIPAADLIILPGSKNVRDDLHWLHQQGWADTIQRHLRYGGKLLGICGGLQMLGNAIHDPEGIEGDAGSTSGLGLLNFSTTLQQKKQLRNVRGTLLLNGVDIHGYEIHAGISHGPALNQPLTTLNGQNDGAISDDRQIIATYLHGLFESPGACQSLLEWAGLQKAEQLDYRQLRETAIDRIADAIEEGLSTHFINNIIK